MIDSLDESVDVLRPSPELLPQLLAGQRRRPQVGHVGVRGGEQPSAFLDRRAGRR
jgi:hypothetical protein